MTYKRRLLNAAFCFIRLDKSKALFWLCRSLAEPAQPKVDLLITQAQIHMSGIIVRITPSGDYVLVLVRLEDGRYGRTYTGESYRNYQLWRELKVGDLVAGLRWKREGQLIIDADSPVHLAQDALL